MTQYAFSPAALAAAERVQALEAVRGDIKRHLGCLANTMWHLKPLLVQPYVSTSPVEADGKSGPLKVNICAKINDGKSPRENDPIVDLSVECNWGRFFFARAFIGQLDWQVVFLADETTARKADFDELLDRQCVTSKQLLDLVYVVRVATDSLCEKMVQHAGSRARGLLNELRSLKGGPQQS